MYQKVNVLIFFMHVQKRQFYLKKKNSSLTILLSSLGLHLSSLLVRCVEDVACKSSHNNLFNERFNLYMFNVIYMWHVPFVVLWGLFATCFTMCTRILDFHMFHIVWWNSWELVEGVGNGRNGIPHGLDMIKAHIVQTCFSRLITSYRCWKMCLMSLTWWEELYIKLPKNKNHWKFITIAFLYHGCLPFSTIPLLIPNSNMNSTQSTTVVPLQILWIVPVLLINNVATNSYF